MEIPMRETIDAGLTSGGRILPDSLRRHGVLIGGVAAGLVLVGLATYTFATVKSAPATGTLVHASDCEAQPISIMPGQNAEATMTVSPRMRCPIATGFATASIDDLSIIDAPKHGTLMQQGRTGMVYQSDGNFRGQDSFAFAMHGKSVDHYDGAAGGTSVIRAHVTVK
jgi:hypothetical protein